MGKYVEDGYVQIGYVEGNEEAVTNPPTSENCDLTLLLNSINSLVSKVDSIDTKLQNLSLSSLDGNGCEFRDGVKVVVSGRSSIIYTVERSFISLYSDNGYTVHYDLLSSDGYRCTVPEALLTKYILVV